jgi:hypothetical protein
VKNKGIDERLLALTIQPLSFAKQGWQDIVPFLNAKGFGCLRLRHYRGQHFHLNLPISIDPASNPKMHKK